MVDMTDIEKVLKELNITEHIYDGMTMSSFFPASNLDMMKKTIFHDDDIFVATYPKCGTTWMQEVVSCILSDGDTQKADQIPLVVRYNFIDAIIPNFPSGMDLYASTPAPHLIKSHCRPYFYETTLREKKTKFVVVMRNPKDNLVSYYHFYRSNIAFNFNGTWEEFFSLFKEKKLAFGDLFEYQLAWWKIRDDPNVLIVKYEDMLKEPEVAIRQVEKHLGKQLSEEAVKKIVHHTSFKVMKENPMANFKEIPNLKKYDVPFMRKGTVGDWRNTFSDEQAKYVDELSKKHFEPVGLVLEDQ